MRARQPSVPNVMVVGAGAGPGMVTSVLRLGAALQEPLDGRTVRAGPAQDRDRLRRRHPTPLRWRDDAQPVADATDDQVVVLDVDRLARLDHRTGAARTEPGQQR